MYGHIVFLEDSFCSIQKVNNVKTKYCDFDLFPGYTKRHSHRLQARTLQPPKEPRGQQQVNATHHISLPKNAFAFANRR